MENRQIVFTNNKLRNKENEKAIMWW
jgi:hypothetical protein